MTDWVVFDPNVPRRPAEPGPWVGWGWGLFSAVAMVVAVVAFLYTYPGLPPATPPATNPEDSITNGSIIIDDTFRMGFSVLLHAFPYLLGVIVVSRVSRKRWVRLVEQREDEHRDQVRAWKARHQVSQKAFPVGPVRELADGLVAEWKHLKGTRTFRDGWVGEDGERALHLRCWSLLSRLRDSVDVRADLEEAAELHSRTSDLERLVTERKSEVEALDAEVASVTDQLEQLTVHARDLDAALEAEEVEREEAERRDRLAQRLEETTDTASEWDTEHRRLRDRLLAESPENDLSILKAGLHALTEGRRR